jgi:hypothetical protein
MSKKLFFGLILSASGKMHLLPGFWRQNQKLVGIRSLRIRVEPRGPQFTFLYLVFSETAIQIIRNFEKIVIKKFLIAIKILFFWTNENKKTSGQLIFVHIFRKKHFEDKLENFMSEPRNATTTPLIRWPRLQIEKCQIIHFTWNDYFRVIPTEKHYEP